MRAPSWPGRERSGGQEVRSGRRRARRRVRRWGAWLLGLSLEPPWTQRASPAGPTLRAQRNGTVGLGGGGGTRAHGRGARARHPSRVRPSPRQGERPPGHRASPLHRLAEQHDDLLLHVVLPGGLHGHHGRHVAAGTGVGVRATPRAPSRVPEPRTS